MSAKLKSFTRVVLLLTMCLAIVPAVAQKQHEQAKHELARKVSADSVQACSLITRAEVKKATGRDPFVDPEPAGQGGWICNVGIGELKVYSGPKSWEAWEATMKSFKKDKGPNTPAPGFGDRAYFFYPKPENQYQGNVAFLVANSGNYTIALSLDAPEGQAAGSMRPALEELMKKILARLP